MLKKVLILCLILSLGISVFPISHSFAQEKGEETKEEVITIDYPTRVNILDFLRLMQEKLGVSMITSPGVTGTINPIKLTATPEVILDRILTINGYEYDYDRKAKIITVRKAKKFREEREKEMVSETFKPKYTKARLLESRLRGLKSADGKVLIEDLQNIIFVTDYPAYVKTMKDLVKALDVEMKGMITTRVFSLEYQVASEVAKNLKKLKSKKGKVVADDISNTITVTDFPAVISSMEKYIESVDAKSLVIKQFRLNYAKAEDVKKTLEEFCSSSGKIEIDKRTNVVIIKDMPEYIKDIERQIELLDVMTKQVLVETTFIEITWEGTFDTGIDWNMFESTTNSGILWGANPYNRAPASKVGLAIAHTDIIKNFSVYLKKQTKVKNINILSNPKVVVTDGKEASIKVGRKYPAVATTTSTAAGVSVTSVSLSYEEAFVELKVTPEIKPNNVISLDVATTVKAFKGYEEYGGISTMSAPLIDVRELEIGQIDIKDGKTAILGGLIKEENSITEYRFPFLSRIPLLGLLFKETLKSPSKSELIVFITPHLLPPTLALDHSEKMEQMLEEMGRIEWGKRKIGERGRGKGKEELSEFEKIEREIFAQ